MTTNDYGSWLTEDLESLQKDLHFQKQRVETYSERVDLNIEIREIKKELRTRKENE